MKPELKAKWLEALRSGHYAQDFEHLRTTKGFCCLGVLLDVFSQETGKGCWTLQSTNNFDFVFEDDDICLGGHLTAELENFGRRLVGMRELDEAHLITMNDTQKSSFAEIADWVEANIKTS